jgi:hypothetical protein
MAFPLYFQPLAALARGRHGPTVRSRAARRPLCDPHPLRAGAFLGAPARALAAVATFTSIGSVASNPVTVAATE